MIEEILDGQVPVTDRMIKLLLKENQKKLLIKLIAIPEHSRRAKRPKYICLDSKKYSQSIKKAIFKRGPTKIKLDGKGPL